MVLFAAKPVGGEIKCQEGETIAVEWFAFDRLPSPLSLGHARRIQDAIGGATGIVVVQEIQAPNMPNQITRKELYERRDASGLSRQEFYLQMVGGAGLKEIIEVGQV
jgi:hypothetical protein